ncbi:hypothetical protein M433DRAFT_424909 [Acidomyces richmondensis BFW]|nr:MAG: hypothetical protein FE78DRAFT_255188 [Acidomyces sp. 'richmondensis']KYG50371.1 hypothetical protein M433DRAFT_424909 [Acidomyces richmondensis BFW]
MPTPYRNLKSGGHSLASPIKKPFKFSRNLHLSEKLTLQEQIRASAIRERLIRLPASCLARTTSFPPFATSLQPIVCLFSLHSVQISLAKPHPLSGRLVNSRTCQSRRSAKAFKSRNFRQWIELLSTRSQFSE